METIKRSAVDIRLNPLGWPAGLDSKDIAASSYEDAAVMAGDIYRAFAALADANAKGGQFTPAGARTANAAWAADKLPALRAQLDKVRAEIAATTASAMKSMTSSLAAPTEDPADIAMSQEIRTWLRSLPEEKRALKVHELARNGDRTALRAVLTAPSYLTGVSEEQLGGIWDMVAQADNPERFAKLQLVKKAAEFAERACDGVIRYIEQETVTAAPIGAPSPRAA